MIQNETKDKLRAVFLTAIMILSVFAGSAGLVGTVAAANGSVSTDADAYGNNDTIAITVEDSGANELSGNTEEVTVQVDADSGDTETGITLTETGEDTGKFTGEITVNDDDVANDDGDLDANDGNGITVTYTDTNENTRTATATFDTTTPGVTFSVTKVNSGDDVKIEIDSNEELSDINVELAREPHGTTKTLTKEDFQANSNVYTYTISDDGEFTATLNTAADAAGNDGASGQSSSATVTEGSSLSFDNFSPADGEVVTDNQTQISVDITDSNARVDHNKIRVALSNGKVFERLQYGDDGFSWDGTTLTIDPSAAGVKDLEEGDVTVHIYAENTGDNSALTTHTFRVDSEAPDVSLTGPADGNTKQAGQVLEFQVTDASSLNPAKFNVHIEDENGNVLVDSGDAPDYITLSGETLTIDPSGSDSPIEGGEWPEGELSVTITAADTHSNTDSTDFTVDVDLTPPGVDQIDVDDEPITASDTKKKTVTVHFNESIAEGTTVTLANDANGVTLDSGEFVDADTWEGELNPSDFSGVDDNVTFTVTSTVTDVAGNELGDEDSDTVHIDTLEPTVTFSPDSSFETHDGTTVISGDVNLGNLFDTSDVDDAELTYEYTTADSPDSEDWTEVDSANVDSFDTADNFSDGEVTIRLTAVDEVENSGQDWGTVVVDNDNPSVEGTYEDADFGDGEAVYGEIDLTEAFDVSNADGQDVTYYYNTSNTDGYQSIGSTTLDTSTLDNGPLGLKAEVTDLAGNTVEGEANVTINNIKIDTFDVSADEGESTATINITTNAKLENVTIEVSQNDGYFDEAETVTLDRQDFTAVKEDPENKTFEYTGQFDAPRDGEFKADFVSANATDGQRLVDSTESDTVKIDAEDPSVTDAEIVDADESGTTVRVEFNEPVSANTLNADSFEIEGDRADVALDNSNAIVTATGDEGYVNVTFDGHFQTGDEPNLTVADDAYDEESFVETQNSTSADDTTTVHTLELNLEEGHNVVSVPAASGTVDLSELDALTESDTVWAYDEDGWISYTPGDDTSELETLEGGQGYIFVMDSAADVDMNVYNQPGGSGDIVSSTPESEDVHEGWNLLGHWQEGTQPRDDALSAIDSYGGVYEQTNNGELSFSVVSSGDDLEPGEGYWVFVDKDDGDVYGEHAWATS